MSAITYAPDLVEEAVLLAERTMNPADARAFRRERDRLYAVSDPDRREADFRALHVRWFTHAGLHRVIEETMAGRADMLDRVAGCRVSLAFTGRDEGADLIDPPAVMAGAGRTKPTLALRLRPATLLRPGALRALLLHELMHVADMLDPQTRTLRVHVELPNPGGRFRPEMFGTMRHTGALRSLPVVPMAAVVQEYGRNVVFVELAPGRFERRQVALGPRSGDVIAVPSGLHAGDRVVVGGAILLKGQ